MITMLIEHGLTIGMVFLFGVWPSVVLALVIHTPCALDEHCRGLMLFFSFYGGNLCRFFLS